MKFPISLCVIAKNCEQEIVNCLSGLNDIFQEIILIDTGSEDETPLVARKFEAKVYSHKWKNDFSEARNSAFEYVTQPWNFWLDTDEILLIKNTEKFYSLISESKNDSFFITRKEILDNNEIATTTRCRILKTAKNFRFEGVIHETPNINFYTTEHLDESVIFIRHYGYNKEYKNPETKSKRNIDILKKAHSYDVLDSWNKIYNAVSLVLELNTKEDLPEKKQLLERIGNALKNYSKEEIRNNAISLSYYFSLIQTYISIGNTTYEEEACLDALEIFPDSLNILSMLGEYYYKSRNYEKSLGYYYKIMERVKNDNYLKGAFLHEGIKNYGTLYNIALCYKQLNMHDKAVIYLFKALEVNPDFLPASELLKTLKKNFG